MWWMRVTGHICKPEKVMHDLKDVLKQALDELQPMDAQATMRSTLSTFNEVWQQQFRSSVLSQFQDFPEQTQFLIGCSGGMDSMLLLHSIAGCQSAVGQLCSRTMLCLGCPMCDSSGGC
jgi:hypothetical protein